MSQREQERKSPFVFASEHHSLRQVLHGRSSARVKCHPHMLRHACGYALANAGHKTRAMQIYLGHRNIQHTVRYTKLSPTRFKDFWRE